MASSSGAAVRGNDGVTRRVSASQLLVFFGLHPKLGPIADWGLELNRRTVRVDAEKFATSVPGIFAVGDINDYPGKKKLILSGFHETALAAFAIQAHLRAGEESAPAIHDHQPDHASAPGRRARKRRSGRTAAPLRRRLTACLTSLAPGVRGHVSPCYLSAGRTITRAIYSGRPSWSNPSVPPLLPRPARKSAIGRLLAHLSALLAFFTVVGGIIGPLVIWLIRKEDMSFAADQAKEALNFQITVFLAGIVSAILCLILIGFVLLAILALADLILIIIAAVKASEGVAYRYPFNLRLIN